MSTPGLFARYVGNPILSAADIPYRANTVFNAAAAAIDGESILLMRVEDLRGISHLTVARSDDGRTGWHVDPEPTLMPDADHHPEEVWGIEDPRITWLPEREEWAVAYTAFSRRGPLVSLATTHDFRQFHRLGPAMPPEDKDAALFPRRIDGRWALHPSPDAARRPRSYLARVLARPAALGRPHPPPARARGSMVGRRQDRARTPAPRDTRGMAHALSRCPFHRERLAVSSRAGAPGPRGSAPGPSPHRRVGVRAVRVVRADGRCRGCRLPVRLDPRPDHGRAADLLRRGRLRDRARDGDPLGPRRVRSLVPAPGAAEGGRAALTKLADPLNRKQPGQG